MEQDNDFQETILFDIHWLRESFQSYETRKSFGHPETQGVPNKIFNLIEAQYKVFTSKVLHSEALFDSIRLVTVKQGYIRSPEQ